MSINMTNAYEGGAIILNDGMATMLKDVGNHGYVGGAFRVAADSTLRLDSDAANGGRGATNGSLAFTAAGRLGDSLLAVKLSLPASGNPIAVSLSREDDSPDR
jgi:hypothetical protein